MATPEGRTKSKISKILKEFDKEDDPLWSYMPVPGGWGRRTVDYLCLYRAVFFAIEAKAPGKKPTKLQADELEKIHKSGGKCFFFDDPEAVEGLREWLEEVRERPR
jgi:hypothetical protein